MTLGQKIKKERKSKKITQEVLASGRITRNMLSAIENDKANPSLDTLKFIAASLDVPLSYLVSDSDDLFFYKKADNIAAIKECFQLRKYKKCIELIKYLGKTDDELSYMLAISYLELGKEAALLGSLKTADKLLNLAKNESIHTVYLPKRIFALERLYSSVAKNIKSPVLELDTKEFEKDFLLSYDLDFYKFIIGDTEHNYNEPVFASHIKAKSMIKEKNYTSALSILKEIEAEKSEKNYNAYLVLSLYTDMENCYRQLADFENAYKYSAKRMALMDAFNA